MKLLGFCALAALAVPCAALAGSPTLTQTVTGAGITISTIRVVDTDRASGGRTQIIAGTTNGTVGKFSATTGVLTGVTVTSTVSGGSLAGRANSTDVNASTLVRGNLVVTMPGDIIGFTDQQFTAVCCGVATPTTTVDYAPDAVATTIASDKLDSYLATPDSATVAISVKAIALVDFRSSASGSGAGWFAAGKVTPTIDYSYLKHATAAFDQDRSTALTIDFGTLQLGSGVVSRSFKLYNLGDASTVALDLDTLDGGTNALFTTTLAPFAAGLAGGASTTYSLSFDPRVAGVQTNRFTLGVSDADVGVGMRSRTLTIDVRANVLAVPEPATWAMFVAGFGLVGAVARRRVATVAA